MFKFRKIRLVAVVLLFVLAMACVPGAGARKTAGVREHWNNTVAMEDTVEAQFAFIVQSTNEGYQEIKTKYPLVDQCFVNSGNVLHDAVAGRYDNSVLDPNAPTNSPTGDVNGLAIGRALVINEAYPGDVAECQRLTSEVAGDVSVWRKSRINEFRHLWDMKQDLDTQYQGDLYRAIAIDLLQFAQDEAVRLGVAVPKYVYPTFHLEVVSRDQDICQYYQAEWNPALQQCRLNGQGAYDYIFRPFVAVEVQESFDSGIDDLDPFNNRGE